MFFFHIYLIIIVIKYTVKLHESIITIWLINHMKFFPDLEQKQSIVLTNVETVRSIPLWREREAITVFIGFQMPDATLKSGPHRKSLEAGCVSRSADEQWLAEGNSRKQALQSNPERPGSRICGKFIV